MSRSIVYVLSNPAMPGLVKIGYTANEDASERIAQLYSSGVPFPFHIEFAASVEDGDSVEKALHEAFGPHRVNPKREFFNLDPSQVIAILRLLHCDGNEVSSAELPTGGDEVENAAAEQFRRRRPNLNFDEMGIPQGAELHFIRSDSTVTVTGSKKVRLGDTEMFLSAATRELLGLDYNVAPAPYWKYNGRPLTEIYEETYPRAD